MPVFYKANNYTSPQVAFKVDKINIGQLCMTRLKSTEFFENEA